MTETTPTPTVVLVHGAFADSSGFDAVIRRLLAAGYPVLAAPNPLRGVAADAAGVRALLDSVEGPVVLVGHSYGGAVISVAAAESRNVRALVYLAAFVPNKGEAVGELVDRFPGSTVNESLKPVPLPDGQVDLYIDPRVYHERFAADVPATDAAVYSIAQRPASAAAFAEPAAGAPAWTEIPSYHLIGTADLIIPPAAQQFMAERAEAAVEVIQGASHLLFVSHPDTTVALIERAARETAG
ncbi:alpha/beta hydrolase [Rugosimonospora acidiphila]|uniref:Alpha/beta hydrolase n=1 Tax=Rugosimonospora acidiphila TaxID=556531 RepID=A0ABP9SNI6_9ACTN